MTTSRPLGMSLIALLFLALAVLTLGIAAFYLLSPYGAQLIDVFVARLGWPAALSGLLAAPPLVAAGISGLVFRGLWQREAWASTASILFSFLAALGVLLGLALLWFFGLTSGLSTTFALALLSVFLAATIYLIWPRRPTPGKGQVPDISPATVVTTPAAQPPIPPVARNVTSRPTLVPPPPRTQSTIIAFPEARTVAASSTPPPAAWLVVRSGEQFGQEFPLYIGGTLTLGRDPSRADAILNDGYISGQHAQVRYEGGRFVLYDLESTNGTYFGQEPIQRQPLINGDEVRLGQTVLLFTTRVPQIGGISPNP